jgi:uncharacterized repeat protein (TIGR03803 family)
MSFPNLRQALTILVGLLLTLSGGAQTYTVLYSFTGGTDGAMPVGGVILDEAGNLYGTTFGLGSLGDGDQLGTVFELSPGGNFTLLHGFGPESSGGEDPMATLVRDSAGNLYGTTPNGGLNYGTVFKVDNEGNFSLLYSFTGQADGYYPSAPVTPDPAGNLYGTTEFGGSLTCDMMLGCGVVYEVNTQGQETVLHEFSKPKYGDFPDAGLILDAADNLYGTTVHGGQAGNGGTVFKLDSAANETVLYSFQKEPDGRLPEAPLIEDAAGNFYGTTSKGGSGKTHSGTVFKLDLQGNETVLYSFTGGSDGGLPVSGLVMGSAGNLYGTTPSGGIKDCEGSGCGVVFKVDPSGHETVLHAFRGGTDGWSPQAGLAIDADGNLYGTAIYGGNLGDCPRLPGGGCGVVFKITP